ncbi:hypothetical protein CSQ91_27310 [Janthinobacterium sp. BJB301]|nr:hypothetical protein CSQ91_27310 [Janthinobacterium sp. BJB301]
MTSIVNWIAAYNYLFAAFNSENKELYVSGVGGLPWNLCFRLASNDGGNRLSKVIAADLLECLKYKIYG